jgi:hypothetical protein
LRLRLAGGTWHSAVFLLALQQCGWVKFGGQWRHREFLKVWAGQTVSLVGSAVTQLPLPLTAVLVLGATPAEMGLLDSFQGAPVLLLGLVAGVWVDRLRRRPVLIATDLGLAALIGSIPFAATLGLLRMEWLYVIGFLAPSLAFTSGLAATAFLHTLIGRERLVAGVGVLLAGGWIWTSPVRRFRQPPTAAAPAVV